MIAELVLPWSHILFGSLIGPENTAVPVLVMDIYTW